MSGKKYLFIIAGQSNAQSTNTGPLNPMMDSASSRIFQYSRGINKDGFGNLLQYNPGQQGTWIKAQHPLQHRLIYNNNSVGFGLDFAKELLKKLNPKDEIYLLNCALGGSGFQPSDLGYGTVSWKKSESVNINLYNSMIEDYNNVMSKNQGLIMSGILWHQGEADAGLNNTNYYYDLVKFITDFRTDMKNTNISFVCGTMLNSWKKMVKGAATVDWAHKSIKMLAPWMTDFCDFDDLVGAYDMVHYNAESQREMGKRYAQKMLQFIQ